MRPVKISRAYGWYHLEKVLRDPQYNYMLKPELDTIILLNAVQ